MGGGGRVLPAGRRSRPGPAGVSNRAGAGAAAGRAPAGGRGRGPGNGRGPAGRAARLAAQLCAGPVARDGRREGRSTPADAPGAGRGRTTACPDSGVAGTGATRYATAAARARSGRAAGDRVLRREPARHPRFPGRGGRHQRHLRRRLRGPVVLGGALRSNLRRGAAAHPRRQRRLPHRGHADDGRYRPGHARQARRLRRAGDPDVLHLARQRRGPGRAC